MGPNLWYRIIVYNSNIINNLWKWCSVQMVIQFIKLDLSMLFFKREEDSLIKIIRGIKITETLLLGMQTGTKIDIFLTCFLPTYFLDLSILKLP